MRFPSQFDASALLKQEGAEEGGQGKRCTLRPAHFVESRPRFRSNQLPAKPIRCRDCMDKVKEGTATKEELSKEREVLVAARSKAEESMGSKLFVGGLSYDATEDELRKIFSAHGELNDVHIAKDKETGRSKGFAFVTFSSKKEGLAAVKELNDTEIHSQDNSPRIEAKKKVTDADLVETSEAVNTSGLYVWAWSNWKVGLS